MTDTKVGTDEKMDANEVAKIGFKAQLFVSLYRVQAIVLKRVSTQLIQ